MKKTLFILAIVLCGSGVLFAQKPMTGFVGSGVSGIVDASLGMPVAGVASSAGYTITSGLPYSHLKKVEYSATADGGSYYEDEYFVFDPVTVADGQPPLNPHYKYNMHPDPKHYDVLAILNLIVTACGPGVTADFASGNSYESVPVAGYCWTKQNLREIVPGSRVYDDNTDDNFINKYGRLYTWYEAVGVDDNGSVMPTPDATTGFVQGMCPIGWHIPTGAEMTALRSIPDPLLNATTDWTGPHAGENTNEKDFSAYPAGIYNASLNRYEGLGTQTDWWSDVYTSNAGIVIAKVTEISYYCDVPMEKQFEASNAMSVRCVKDHD